MVFFRLTWRGDVSIRFSFTSSSHTWLCSFGLGVLAKRPSFFLSYDVTSALVRVPEPYAMMFLFQDGADDRKKNEHYVINVCCVVGMRVTQDAICEVSATMVLSTSEAQEFHATVSNCNTRSFFTTHGDVLIHHPFHILQSLCDVWWL